MRTQENIKTILLLCEIESMVREIDESLDLYDGMYPVQRRLHQILDYIEGWRDSLEVDYEEIS